MIDMKFLVITAHASLDFLIDSLEEGITLEFSMPCFLCEILPPIHVFSADTLLLQRPFP